MKKSILGALFALALLIPAAASAYEVNSGESIYIDKDRTVEGNLYAAGSNITVEGKVTGDLICAGQSITVNGTVEGDVLCAGQSITVNGQVKGNIRTAGAMLAVNGQIERNLMFFGASYSLSDKAKIGWDNMVAAASVLINGEVGRSLHGSAAAANINGKIGGDVRLWMDDRKADKPVLVINDKAQIGGSVVYRAARDADISDQARIKGEKKRNAWPEIKGEDSGSSLFGGWLFSLLAAFLVGLVLVSLWPNLVRSISSDIRTKTWPAIGWGAVVLFLTPIICIIAFITLVGIPMSLITLGIYMISLFISILIAAFTVGQMFIERYWTAKKDSLIWTLALGCLFLWILIAIPVIGIIIKLAALFAGLGGVFLALRSSLQKS